ncbi:MAG: PP2C family protein-serine/threonine phosphatase [Planctomycetota bacterium]|jgi:sigma-B regulation protein RsbU (phosphoserine phosphatase)
MLRWNIIVAASQGQEALAQVVREHLLEAWAGEPAPTLMPVTAEHVQPEDLDAIDAIVLIADRSGPGRALLPLLTALEEAGVPVLALLDGPVAVGNPFEFAGALVKDQTTDPKVLAATLHGLVHRQREVDQLRNEVKLAQRFHGGLRGEIAKMHEQLQLAAIVQREFLPRELPSLHGVEFGALWRAAQYVSGDIYDVARLDEDHIGMFIADAVGHGVPAALMTMIISRSLETKKVSGSRYRIIEPAEVLGILNSEMIRLQGSGTRFATAAYAVIDCRHRRMRVAGAGHPPPMLFRADGPIEFLETSGGLLGVFEDEQYDQVELDVNVNDRLLFYSDGFEQAFPETEGDAYERRLPTDRYLDEFRQLAGVDGAQRMVERIRRRLNDQSGSLHQADDLTLVCMQAGPLPAESSAAPAEDARTEVDSDETPSVSAGTLPA